MADPWGIGASYVDATGREQVIPDETLERLRAMIGHPATVRPPLVVGPGDAVGAGEIVLEDGTQVVVNGTVPPDIPFGYHQFTDDGRVSRQLIVSPRRCHLPPGRRSWGWAAQLYATRSSASWGIGDLGDLARLARWSNELGAGFVLVNPLGAPAPAGPQQPSPYYPASRRYRNPIYLRVEDVPGAATVGEELERATAAARALNGSRTIDRDEVWRIKQPVLESIFGLGAARREFDEWYDRQPDSLRQFATWSVVVEQLGPRWRDWPASHRHPDGASIAMVGEEHADRVRFHAWLQWLIARQLDAAAASTAVIHDVPIGVDPDGFDAWSWQDILALDASVGAPPDAFNRHGQQWGLPPFVPWMLRDVGYQPFIDTIRANIAPGGGMRLDHVAGLFRLWWVPAGNSPTDGAYVHYPADDLLAIVALESHRAASIIVGEDLGTVEETHRHALAAHDILSYRLLWFEGRGPADWPSKAMAAITTHDLPTVAGVWERSDVATQRALGLEPDADANEAIRDRLARAADLPPTATTDEAVVAAHGLLARAPAMLLSATLEDAVAEPDRPNIPGTAGNERNWSVALGVTLEELETHPLALSVAATLGAARPAMHAVNDAEDDKDDKDDEVDDDDGADDDEDRHRGAGEGEQSS
jgi:4-alpha-glucanotransferase